jgi:hypothetical protein
MKELLEILGRGRERQRKYNRRICENGKCWESDRHFIVGRKKKHGFVRSFPGFVRSSF